MRTASSIGAKKLGQPVPLSNLVSESVARIRRVRQKDDAPEVQRRLLRPTYSVSDMKEGLEGARYKSVAAFFNHLRPSQKIDGLLGVADENILKDASFLRRDPSALQ